MTLEKTIKILQKEVDFFIGEHGGYWPPLSMLCAIMEELGELAREVNFLEGYKAKKSKNKNSNLGEELADLLFSIICVANYYQINLGKEFHRVINKYKIRDSKSFQ